MNRPLGLSIRKQLLKKEKNRVINIQLNMWLPNKMGEKAECVRGTDPTYVSQLYAMLLQQRSHNWLP